MDTLVPLTKTDLTYQAEIALYDAIVSGRLHPGERINEEQIADSLGISRGPLREALSALTRRGLAVKIPNRGCFVTRLSWPDVAEVCSLREVLEMFAVDLVIQREGAADLQPLRDIVTQMEPAVDSLDAERLVSGLDLSFHAALVGASGHARLLDAWNNLRPRIQMMLYSRNVVNEDFRSLAVSDHRRVLEALESGDAALTKDILSKHLGICRDRLKEAFSAD
ncbi:MAG TPA: GntR family transcriptional regulator [Capsulimonadaceae bacterium]|jgi:DNA-binding GntR family transcriptional regulator